MNYEAHRQAMLALGCIKAPIILKDAILLLFASPHNLCPLANFWGNQIVVLQKHPYLYIYIYIYSSRTYWD